MLQIQEFLTINMPLHPGLGTCSTSNDVIARHNPVSMCKQSKKLALVKPPPANSSKLCVDPVSQQSPLKHPLAVLEKKSSDLDSIPALSNIHLHFQTPQYSQQSQRLSPHPVLKHYPDAALQDSAFYSFETFNACF